MWKFVSVSYVCFSFLQVLERMGAGEKPEKTVGIDTYRLKANHKCLLLCAKSPLQTLRCVGIVLQEKVYIR